MCTKIGHISREEVGFGGRNPTSDSPSNATRQATVLASESSHWYDKNGQPIYEVPRAKGDGMRPTTLADARKLGLVPSVTNILQCAAKPGLEAWKATQLLQSALTLPKLPDETLDDYAKRVIEDSKAQGKKASERGTELHAAIEKFIQTGEAWDPWTKHVVNVYNTLSQYGIDIRLTGKPEHSFASPLGYGGKIDWHNDEILIDFKTKATVKDVKRLAYDEHCWQLSAYANGLDIAPPRLINVFIGVDDCEVRIHEWSEIDYIRGWKCFGCLLEFWQITKNYNGVTP